MGAKHEHGKFRKLKNVQILQLGVVEYSLSTTFALLSFENPPFVDGPPLVDPPLVDHLLIEHLLQVVDLLFAAIHNNMTSIRNPNNVQAFHRHVRLHY